MTNPHDVIIRPIITEDSMEEMANRKYTFVVSKKANKIDVKQSIEKIFGVKVERVNTMIFKGKIKRQGAKQGKRPDWKKAIVTLTPESKEIEFFEGM